MFGMPQVGLSTIVRVLKQASKRTVVVVETVDDLKKERIRGADVVIVDAIRDSTDVRTLVEERHVDGFCQGCVVQVMNHDVPIRDAAAHAAWNIRRAEIEAAIQLYNLPYHSIQNVRNDLEAPVAELARIARLRS